MLDSTDPAQVKAFEHQIDIAKTLFIVSSKSGSTLEPNIFKQYFFERTKQTVGATKAGSHFIAITDPGSKMQQVAEGDHFLHVFFGRPSIGGRYSALSNFGMVPGAAMGMDTKKFLSRAAEMVRACGPGTSVEENPGAALGIILGAAANAGRDKVTIITSPGISDLGAWLEQLLAESTGKIGKGIIPVDREASYFARCLRQRSRVRLRATGKWGGRGSGGEGSGHRKSRTSRGADHDGGHLRSRRGVLPLGNCHCRGGIDHRHQCLQSAGCRSQQNRDAKLTSEYEKTGSLPAEKPILEDSGIKLFTDEKNAADLAKAAGWRQVVGGIFEGASQPHQGRRLLRGARAISR